MQLHRSIRFVTALLVSTAFGIAQEVRDLAMPDPADGATRYVVQFQKRSFDLAGFRAAARRRAPEREMQRLVASLEAAVRRDQGPFVAAIQRLGGRVTAQWWLVNGCAIEVQAHRLAAVRAQPNVSRVDLDVVRGAHLGDATNNSHHASDQANTMKNSRGEAITGKGVSIAVLDTGADAESGATGRPHRCYYPDGDPGNNNNGGIGGSLLMAALKVPQVGSTEDTTGHGTAVAGCAGANRWNTLPGVDHGIAPGAGIVSVNIANGAGISLDSWMVSGWQLVATVRVKHNIGAGNSSFSGSPQLGNVLQVALDSVAANADILICVSAGNSGSNTTQSQHAYNGLAVGSVDKTWLSRSSSSAIGPLNGSKRTYPDIAAVGNAVVTVLHDKETSKTTVGGTSFAAPMVTGTAALVRQANPELTAAEVKALLLNTTLFRSSDRNQYGIGFMKADAAVAAALNFDTSSGTLVDNRRVANFDFVTGTTGTKTITVAWMRTRFSTTPPNLDLRIYDGSLVVAQDLNTENSYEAVRFGAVANRTYRAEITWVNASATAEPVGFAIAGVTDRSAPKAIKLTPNTILSYAPVQLELVGDALATATEVTLDGRSLPFTVMDDTTIRIMPPVRLPIGAGQLKVTNPTGTSNPLTLTVLAPSKSILAGDGFVIKGPTKHSYWIYSDKHWLSLLMVSLSNKPSQLSGVFDLGIGNNFSELILLVYLSQDASGSSTVQFVYPTSVPSGTQIYFQAMTVDPNAPRLPYPATNVLSVKIF